jgi:hypothetical protein
LRTLWNVGYMGAGNFRSQPRSAFPAIDLEDVRKSSLFARIRQGKHALPFPPPTRQGLPWHELLEGQAEQTHTVDAEVIRDETDLPIGAIIEGLCRVAGHRRRRREQEFVVQHQGKGPRYRLRLGDGTTARLRREPPSMTRKIHLQGHGGFHSYTLEWPEADDGRKQFVPLRAATWARAESEAEHWLATYASGSVRTGPLRSLLNSEALTARIAASLPVPTADALAGSAALSRDIAARIEAAGGWIGFDRFMDLALYSPAQGYYAGGAHKFGAGGDFITAPELGSTFAQTLAAQAAQLLALTSPQIVEVGAGSGQLAADLLLELARRDQLAQMLRHPRTVRRIVCAPARNAWQACTASPATRTLA